MKKDKPNEFAGATPEALAKALLRPIRREEAQPQESRKQVAEEAAGLQSPALSSS